MAKELCAREFSFWLDFCKCRLVLTAFFKLLLSWQPLQFIMESIFKRRFKWWRIFKMGLFNMLCTLVMAGNTSSFKSIWLCGLQFSGLNIARIFCFFQTVRVPPIWQSGKCRTKGCFQQTPASAKAFFKVFNQFWVCIIKQKEWYNMRRAVLCKQITVDVCSTAGLTATLTCSDVIKF